MNKQVLSPFDCDMCAIMATHNRRKDIENRKGTKGRKEKGTEEPKRCLRH